MPIINRGSVALHYELSGDPAHPSLVLSSSLGTDLHMWDPQVEAFAEHFHLLRYDMRGHGSSSTPKGPYSLEDFGRDVLGLLDSLEISRTHFCGLSVGGAIGQWLGIYAPDRLHNLVLCNTASKFGTLEAWNARIADVEANGMSGIANAILTRWFTDSFIKTGNPAIDSLKHTLEQNDVAGYAAACAAVSDLDLRQAVKTITAPTLILAGQSDPVTTVEDAKYLRASIKTSRLVTVPTAHISNIEAPGTFTAEVLRFLLTESER